MGKRTYSVTAGKAYRNGSSTVALNNLSNGIYSISIDTKTGDINKITRTLNEKTQVLVDTAGFNQYSYMPGDSLQNIETSGPAAISIKENGPLLVSLLIKSAAPGADALSREIRLVSGMDKVELINTIDKIAIRKKESVHFSFPFKVDGAQVRYSIPWGSITAESDQLPDANRNWYTMQRWVDISNESYGVTWSSPDAPLFEIGNITTADLLGGLHHARQWLSYTPQSSRIFSWVMNNLWHTNFRVEQEEGPATFHYFFQGHDKGYDGFEANQAGLNDHQPLVVAAADHTGNQVFFKIQGNNIYVESLKPADDGKGVIAQIVNCSDTDSRVRVAPQTAGSIEIWESNLMEEKNASLNTAFIVPARGITTIRIEKK